MNIKYIPPAESLLPGRLGVFNELESRYQQASSTWITPGYVDCFSNEADKTGLYNIMFINSNLIEDSIVGNQNVPMMTCFTPARADRMGSLCEKVFDGASRLQRPLLTGNITTVHITVTNARGHDYKFRGGNTSVTLLFEYIEE